MGEMSCTFTLKNTCVLKMKQKNKVSAQSVNLLDSAKANRGIQKLDTHRVLGAKHPPREAEDLLELKGWDRATSLKRAS